MAYVSVPKDLTKVKNKVAFNLTKRQLICIGIGAAVGIPSYFFAEMHLETAMQSNDHGSGNVTGIFVCHV